MPMEGRFDNAAASDRGVASSLHTGNSAPQAAHTTSTNTPQPPVYQTGGNGSQNFPPQSAHERHPSVNSSFDGNDSTSAELSAYTEQMSKALEQFSLLTKRPSVIQTSF